VNLGDNRGINRKMTILNCSHAHSEQGFFTCIKLVLWCQWSCLFDPTLPILGGRSRTEEGMETVVRQEHGPRMRHLSRYCSGVSGCAVVSMGVQWCQWVWSGVSGCAVVSIGVQWCQWVCSGVNGV
jgi:hypothetical protein